MLSVQWTLEAIADREAIYDFIEQENPSAAIEIDSLFSSSAANLKLHPEIGRLGRVAGTRELVMHTNYILVYDADAANIRILRILHAAMRWPG